MSRIASVWPIVEGVEIYGYRPMPPRAKFTLATDAEQRAAESLAATREGLRRMYLDPSKPDHREFMLDCVFEGSGLVIAIRAAWREAHP